jgi:hypothetical protein
MNKTLPTRPYGNKSMWFQYLSAGEEAARKHDNSLAKRYWIGSLKALEDAPSPQQGNALFLVQMSSLERHLISTYSTTLGLKDLESEERVKLTGEQVDVYDRMTRLNKKFAQPTDLLVTKSQERADQARADLEKAKEAAKADSEPK